MDSTWRRWRSVLIGLVLVPVNIYFLLFMEVVTRYAARGSGGPYPSTISLFANAILFLILVSLLNVPCARLLNRLGARSVSPLGRGEMLVIYVMLTISTAIVSIDFLDVLVPMLTFPFRFATLENRWADTIQPHIPGWASVRDPAALKGWYEGGTTLWNWPTLRVWLVPVAAWSAVIFAMLFVMFCINTIVRRQWTEHDKLQFPIVQLPMQLTEPGGRLWRSRLMWIGFGIAAGISLVNGLATFWPQIPALSVKMRDIAPYFTTKPWNQMGRTPISFYPYAIGLGYLLPLDMLFSCWFFFVTWRVIRIVGGIYGAYDATPNFPFMNQQALGAYYLIGLMALWSGRKHLRRVFAAAFRHTKDPTEAEGPMSYRSAVFGLIAGTLAVIVFFCRLGLTWWLAVLCIGLYFFLALAIARMHAEFGPPAHDLHYIGPEMVAAGAVGTASLGAGDLVGLGWFWWFNRAYRSIPIAYQLDGLKIAERSNTPQRYMGAAIAVASVAAVVSGFVIYLHFGYTRGASVGMAGHVWGFGYEAFGARTDAWMRNPTGPDISATLAIGWGTAFAYFLYVMKLRLAWWPFHPLGFAVSTSYSIGTLWLPMLIAWAAKLVTLRVGGLKSYRVALDFFLGLLLGDFVMGTIWPLVGWILNVPTYSFMQ